MLRTWVCITNTVWAVRVIMKDILIAGLITSIVAIYACFLVWLLESNGVFEDWLWVLVSLCVVYALITIGSFFVYLSVLKSDGG